MKNANWLQIFLNKNKTKKERNKIKLAMGCNIFLKTRIGSQGRSYHGVFMWHLMQSWHWPAKPRYSVGCCLPSFSSCLFHKKQSHLIILGAIWLHEENKIHCFPPLIPSPSPTIITRVNFCDIYIKQGYKCD